MGRGAEGTARMKIGFTLPQFGPVAGDTGELVRFAREAERLGADSLWVGDRLLAAVNPTVGYGGRDTIPETFHSVLDPFALMSAAAAVTERVEIGANVLIAPWYSPAVLARSLTTIDRVSGGRLLPGFGTGWSPEEYEAAGVPMSQRGARLDECLDAVFAWWSDNPVEYSGQYWSVPSAHVDIKPDRRPRPPVYLAGFAGAAVERVARRSDGWLPLHVPDADEFDPEAVNGPMSRIRRLAGEVGRDPAALGAVFRVYPLTTEALGGVVDTIVRAERDTDVDHAFVEMMNLVDNVDQALDTVERVLRAARG